MIPNELASRNLTDSDWELAPRGEYILLVEQSGLLEDHLANVLDVDVGPHEDALVADDVVLDFVHCGVVYADFIFDRDNQHFFVDGCC